MSTVRMATLLGILILATSLQGKAQLACPWMNAATARGAMGGDATTMSVKLLKSSPLLTPGARPDSECDFTVPGTPSHLRIRVETRAESGHTAASSCSSGERSLPGLGNEAVACSSRVGGMVTEKVTGRVRERFFQIFWTHPVQPTKARQDTYASAEDTVLALAEQVAGSLF